MKDGKKASGFRPKKGTVALLAAAAVLLAGSAIGSTRAALTYYSENYTAQLEISQIGVTLLENGSAVSHRNYTGGDANDGFDSDGEGKLLGSLVKSGEKFQVGRKYTENLTVQNTGEIDQYVRVRLYKSWTKDGKKETSLSPDLIEVGLAGGWEIDQASSTKERTVLYYPKILKAGETAPAFADSLRISPSVLSDVKEETKTEDGKTITTKVYAYDGVTFNLEAEVDAVQTHNAQDAIKSAWGMDVSVGSDGTISLQ